MKYGELDEDGPMTIEELKKMYSGDGGLEKLLHVYNDILLHNKGLRKVNHQLKEEIERKEHKIELYKKELKERDREIEELREKLRLYETEINRTEIK